MRQGDVITSINHQPIESLTDFQKIVESLPVNKAVAVDLSVTEIHVRCDKNQK